MCRDNTFFQQICDTETDGRGEILYGSKYRLKSYMMICGLKYTKYASLIRKYHERNNITIYLLRNSLMNIKLFLFLISVYLVILCLSIVYYIDYHATSSQVYQPT